MNKFRKYIRILFVLVFSSLMLLAAASPAAASGGDSPLISIDPTPVVVTIFMVFGLFFAISAMIYFLVNHVSESKTRVKRLSKIESEETIQLYDDLEAAKWDSDIIPEEKPREVQIENELKKRANPSDSNKSDGYEEPRHGPVPERDMPGYKPYSEDEDGQPKPLTPMPTPPNIHAQAPNMAPPPQMGAPMMYGQMPPAAPAPYPYAQMNMQPRVYRPDSDVEIIMNDTSVYAQSAAQQTPAAAPAKVRAYRRRGRLPVQPAVYTAPVAYTEPETEAALSAAAEEAVMPRVDIRHLNIGPLGNAGERVSTEEPASYTLNVNIAEASAPKENEPLREAPILDPGAVPMTAEKTADEATVIRESALYSEATVEIDPPRRGVNETVLVKLGDDIVDGKLMRTLDDVLEELGDDDTTEIEAPISPVYEEELVFLGSETVSADDVPADDVFDDEEGEGRMFIDGKYVHVRYLTSFMSRFIQSEELYQDYYSVIKNILMSYEGVSAEISWSCETFTKGGKVCAKVNMKDKMLLLYLALDPEKYKNSKYHYSYSYDKYAKYKNSKVSMMLKIKSDRALKYAIELIMDMMSELGTTATTVQDIDYRHVYESTEQLIARGLIKILPTGVTEEKTSDEEEVNVAEIIEGTESDGLSELDAGAVFDFEMTEEPEVTEEPEDESSEYGEETVVFDDEPEAGLDAFEIVTVIDSAEETAEETAEEAAEEATEESVEPTEESVEQEAAPDEIPVLEVIHAAATEVDALISDEEALESIEIVEDKTHSHSGKMVEVNLDSICEAFSDGDVVTIDELKAKKLVGKSAGRVKILARGVMTKTLTVYADKFSLQAVKMIKLAGGHAEQYK